MRIAFTSDIHIDLNPPETLPALAAHLTSLSADVVVIAGDLATGATTWLRTLLALRPTAPHLLVLAGNHDVWTTPEAQKKGYDAWTWLDKLLPALCAEAGVHYLDGGALTLGNVGFVGTLGWYDLSLREHLLDVPMEAYRTGEWGGMKWMDHVYARWPDADGAPLPCEAISERLRARFTTQLQGLTTRRVVAATHMLAFPDQIFSKQHPGWRFVNAFMGSRKLGDVIRADPRVVLAIAGHTHIPSDTRQGHVRAVVSPLGYRREWRASNVTDAITKAVTVVDLPGT